MEQSVAKQAITKLNDDSAEAQNLIGAIDSYVATRTPADPTGDTPTDATDPTANPGGGGRRRRRTKNRRKHSSKSSRRVRRRRRRSQKKMF